MSQLEQARGVVSDLPGVLNTWRISDSHLDVQYATVEEATDATSVVSEALTEAGVDYVEVRFEGEHLALTPNPESGFEGDSRVEVLF